MNAARPRCLPAILGCFALALALAGTWAWDLFCGSPVESLLPSPAAKWLIAPIGYILIACSMAASLRLPKPSRVIAWLTVLATLVRPASVLWLESPFPHGLLGIPIALFVRATGSWLTVCVAWMAIGWLATDSAPAVACAFVLAHVLTHTILTLPPQTTPEMCALMPSLAVVLCAIAVDTLARPARLCELAKAQGASEAIGRHRVQLPSRTSRMLSVLVLLPSVAASLAQPVPTVPEWPIELGAELAPLFAIVAWRKIGGRLCKGPREHERAVDASRISCLAAAIPPIIALVATNSGGQPLAHLMAHDAFSLIMECFAWLFAIELASRSRGMTSFGRLLFALLLISFGHLFGALAPPGAACSLDASSFPGSSYVIADSLVWHAIPLASMSGIALLELGLTRREGLHRDGAYDGRSGAMLPANPEASRKAQPQVVRPLPSLLLTKRESQVFELMNGGASVVDIAATLGLSPSTVRVHAYNIRKKLQGCSTPETTHGARQPMAKPCRVEALTLDLSPGPDSSPSS